MTLVKLATCNLDQWALDFDGNLARIRESIRIAKAAGATYRLGPELEVCGYGCEDHFFETDTFLHCWESLAILLSDRSTDGIVCDIGMPVLHRGVRYNCRVFCLNGKILLIRPKLFLADDGNYRESRWFTAWPTNAAGSASVTSASAGGAAGAASGSSGSASGVPGLQDHELPGRIRTITGQRTVPFGVSVLAFLDATVAAEACEELFTPRSPHIDLSLDGVDIITNGSGSHHQLRKLHTRVDLMKSATTKAGGVYMYANQQGCDGGRLYFDGCATIFVNGDCVAQASQFSLKDVEVITAVVDLDDVRSMRASIVSRSVQAAHTPPAPRIFVDFTLALPAAVAVHAVPTPPRAVFYHTPEEEIALGPACWLWDYVRRVGAAGFFLPLSGGADSAATASLVGVMTHLIMEEVTAGNSTVIADLRRVLRESPTYFPASQQEIASRMLHTCYMGTTNSSEETKARAASVARDIGAFHLHATIDAMVAAVIAVFVAVVGTSFKPRFELHGGTRSEDLALQNIQARLRMVLAYFMAQLLPWVRGSKGFLLVLGSANVDEALRGYMTKYDCSSADINPIGAIAKGDLKNFLLHASTKYGFSSLRDVVAAPPTAELQPTSAEESPTTASPAAAAVASPGAAASSALPSGHRAKPCKYWETGFCKRGAACHFSHEGAPGHAVPSAPTSDCTSTSGPAVAAAITSAPHTDPSASTSVAAPSAVVASASTADATPKKVAHQQLDEADMGMSYEELGWFGRLRKIHRCGPLSMYHKLRAQWSHLTSRQVAEKVKRFFYFYGVNRHKMTTLTPSYHAENYSPDDNRYDLRPFLYNNAWTRQFADIDADVASREAPSTASAAAATTAGDGGARATAVGDLATMIAQMTIGPSGATPTGSTAATAAAGTPVHVVAATGGSGTA